MTDGNDVKSDVLDQFLKAAVNLLQQGSVAERATAAGVLGTLGTEDLIPTLLDVLRNDENRQVQHKVSQAIARIGGDAAINGLQELMYDSNQYTRFLAAEALADIIASGTGSV